MYDDTPAVATIVVRALGAGDASAARALLLPAWDEGNPYIEGLLSRVDRAARQETAETLGIVGVIEDTLVAVALFGMVAGSVGTAALYGMFVGEDLRRRGIGAALLRGIVTILAAEHTRLLVAEVPDDPATLTVYRGFLRRQGFIEESRIPDFVRDGMALTLWRREI